MPSVVSRRWRRITSVRSRLRRRSWPCSDAASCLIARRSVAFLRPWTRRVWKRCVACSCRTRWLARDPPRGWEVCGTGEGNDGWSSIWTAPGRPHDSVLCLRGWICPLHSGGFKRAVPLATPGASGGESCAPAPRSCSPIPISGWARLAMRAMLTTEGKGSRGLEVIAAYQAKLSLPRDQALIRLDGQYGNGAIVAGLQEAGIPWLMRGKDDGLLDLAPVKARLALPAGEQFVHPESGVCRDLFECGELPVTAEGHRSRVIIATHPAGTTTSPIGVTRDGVVYELFFTALPALGFSAADVVKLYLHRGSFETVLADEDREQDSDRWSSYTTYGQETWQILSQWMWNLRQELSQQWRPTSMRLTEFAPPRTESLPSETLSPTGPPPHLSR